MKRYLLSVYQPDGEPPPADALAEIARDVRAVDERLRSAGAWVFSGGLHAPGTATVLLQPHQEEVLTTDGPYLEGKEHIGGFTIVKVASLDEALEWGRELARATTLPIEVRPFQDQPED